MAQAHKRRNPNAPVGAILQATAQRGFVCYAGGSSMAWPNALHHRKLHVRFDELLENFARKEDLNIAELICLTSKAFFTVLLHSALPQDVVKELVEAFSDSLMESYEKKG
jgi:hypothetical protein